MRFRGYLCIASVLAATTPAHSQEWWHGEFASEQATSCERTDTLVRYGATAASPSWESYCDIDKTTSVRGMKAVILDMTCMVEDAGPDKGRQLILGLDDGRMALFPNFRIVQRCDKVGQALTAWAEDECPFQDRLYHGETRSETGLVTTHQLRFTSMIAGSVELVGQQSEQLIWRAAGDYSCSNGAVICRLHLPVAHSAHVVSLPVEWVRPVEASPSMIVAPSLAEEVYLAEKHAEATTGHFGLKVEFVGGYRPEDGEFILPPNVFHFAGCMG